MSDMSGARQVLRACADAGGWPWCDEHQAPRWHHDAIPGGPGWCFTCERMHKPMEWGDGCQDWQDARAADIEAAVTGHERAARRCSWPLQRRSSRAGWQAMETRWEAGRAERTFALDNREARFTPSGEIQWRDEEADCG